MTIYDIMTNILKPLNGTDYFEHFTIQICPLNFVINYYVLSCSLTDVSIKHDNKQNKS